MMKDKKIRFPGLMRDSQRIENQNRGANAESDSENEQLNYLPPATATTPTTSAIDLLIQQARSANPRFGESDNSYHFSDEDETTVATMAPIELLYQWVKTLQSREKKNQELLKQLHTEARQHRTLRTGVILLCAVTVFLSLANIGTSFAAARLTRDSKVMGNDLVSLGNERLGTTSKDFVVNMKPWDSSSRRLQWESNDPPENDTSDKEDFCINTPSGASCHIEGTITSADAASLYDAFCPRFQELGFCSGEGVEQLTLNCNGRMSTLFGGMQLPPTPPTDVGDYMAYPTSGRGYMGKASVFLFGRLIPCVQDFTVGMYCPKEENMVATNSSDTTDDCLVFVSWEPGVCLGRVELCGTPSVSIS